jgi:hypothetical protein
MVEGGGFIGSFRFFCFAWNGARMVCFSVLDR